MIAAQLSHWVLSLCQFREQDSLAIELGPFAKLSNIARVDGVGGGEGSGVF